MRRAICRILAFIALANGSFVLGREPESGQTCNIGDPADFRHWLENMVGYHGYSREEILEVTGLRSGELENALKRYRISPSTRPLASTSCLIPTVHSDAHFFVHEICLSQRGVWIP